MDRANYLRERLIELELWLQNFVGLGEHIRIKTEYSVMGRLVEAIVIETGKPDNDSPISSEEWEYLLKQLEPLSQWRYAMLEKLKKNGNQPIPNEHGISDLNELFKTRKLRYKLRTVSGKIRDSEPVRLFRT